MSGGEGNSIFMDENNNEAYEEHPLSVNGLLSPQPASDLCSPPPPKSDQKLAKTALLCGLLSQLPQHLWPLPPLLKFCRTLSKTRRWKVGVTPLATFLSATSRQPAVTPHRMEQSTVLGRMLQCISVSRSG